MASATVETTKVPVTTYEEKKEIVLRLDRDEAEILTALIGSIGGTSRVRKALSGGPQSLYYALKNALGDGNYALYSDELGKFRYEVYPPDTLAVKDAKADG